MKSRSLYISIMAVLMALLVATSTVEALGAHRYQKLSPFGSTPEKVKLLEARVKQ